MRSELRLGLGLLALGIGLAALGGLEKVVLYATRADRVGDSMEQLRQIVPDAIWNITNITIWAGMPCALAGIYLLLRRPFARIAADIKAANERFERDQAE